MSHHKCCFLIVDGYSTLDIVYHWKRKSLIIERKTIAQFYWRKSQLGEEIASYSTGKSCLVLFFFYFFEFFGFALNLSSCFRINISYCLFFFLLTKGTTHTFHRSVSYYVKQVYA